jgi:hypothetical protein
MVAVRDWLSKRSSSFPTFLAFLRRFHRFCFGGVFSSNGNRWIAQSHNAYMHKIDSPNDYFLEHDSRAT